MPRRVTLKDLAKELNVSVTTISKAINKHPDISPARRKQIMALIEERNYIPNYMAKNLRSAKTKFVSLIVSDTANPYYAKVVVGVESALSEHGYHTLIFNNSENIDKETALIKELLSINVAGVLITPALGNSSSIGILKDNDIPFVLLNRYIERDRDNYVIADDEKAAYIGTKHLIETHGKHVAFFNHRLSISTARDRFNGYRRACEEAGIPIRDEYVLHDIISQEDGYKATEEMLSRMGDRKFSVLCYSDLIATGAMLKVQETGRRIPDEVAIMGIDGIEMFSYFYPGLSTVYIPKFDLGAKSAEVLIGIIDHMNSRDLDDEDVLEDSRIIFDPRLEIRGTA